MKLILNCPFYTRKGKGKLFTIFLTVKNIYDAVNESSNKCRIYFLKYHKANRHLTPLTRASKFGKASVTELVSLKSYVLKILK